jgi:hypothetical protein
MKEIGAKAMPIIQSVWQVWLVVPVPMDCREESIRQCSPTWEHCPEDRVITIPLYKLKKWFKASLGCRLFPVYHRDIVNRQSTTISSFVELFF